MIAKVLAPAIVGTQGSLVEVECDITSGLPALVIVGLGNQAVSEARDRVRSAIRNSRLVMPPKRITLNLAPADLPKDGTAYDLSLAMAVLLASGQVEGIEDCLFAGELALDGSLRPVRAVLAYAQLAATLGIERLFVPRANASEAAMIDGVAVFAVGNLIELYGHFKGVAPLTPEPPHRPAGRIVTGGMVPDLRDIRGQTEAKRALEIAAAGGHNLLLSGPPGAGKTMLSRALIGLLPPPELEEMIEISTLHSLAGKLATGIQATRPFRSPHHTASDVALIGGGRTPQPGEISLAHRGVLFLDELPEFRRDVLEVLRQPLEDGQVSVARAAGSVTFPAEFILVAAQNPCPCGFAGDPIKGCECTQNAIGRYRRKLSGPLLDRIDLSVVVNRVDSELLRQAPTDETSAQSARRVAQARRRQLDRGQQALNARLPNHQLRRQARVRRDAVETLAAAMRTLGLSARGYMRALKVSRTIADLEGRALISAEHVREALYYRPTG